MFLDYFFKLGSGTRKGEDEIQGSFTAFRMPALRAVLLSTPIFSIWTFFNVYLDV
jgi:hypothetical protein